MFFYDSSWWYVTKKNVFLQSYSGYYVFWRQLSPQECLKLINK